MAFGDVSKTVKDKAKSAEGGELKQFESQWIPTGSGTRIFRPLQEMRDGKLVLVDRVNASGKPIYEGGKKAGKVLKGPIPAEEQVFMSAWWEVVVNGENHKRRMMLDPFAGGDVNKSRFNNVLWDHIKDNYEQGSQERKVIKLSFAMNVWDMTPIMRNESGQIFYPSEDGHWNLLAFLNNGKLITPKDKLVKLPEHYNMDLEEALEAGYATPLNAIRILEGSYGKPHKEGGKHLFAQFEALIGTTEDGDGVIRNLGEFDLRLTTTGEGINTNRSIRDVHRFNPLPDEANLGTRYDLRSWTAPWPEEAIQRLIDGEDYNEIVEEYDLTTFPKLLTNDTPDVVTEEDGLFDE